MITWILAFTLSLPAMAFVPTVESLFRNGGNPDVTVNGVSLTFSVKKIQAEVPVQDSLLKPERTHDYFKLFLTRNAGDNLKIAQTRYDSASFSEGSLLHKIYFPNFSPYTVKTGVDQVQRGIFFSLIHSIAFNNGSHMINYLKSLNVPVKLNDELINRDKIEHLAGYKRYLITIAKDRNAKKSETNPLRPDDAASREKIDKVMNESMYVDMKQVKLSKENNEMSWLISAGEFQAVISYKRREVQRVSIRTEAGEFVIVCKDYWLANGTHVLPKTMLIKTFNGANYQVEFSNLRHYNEREEDLVNRLGKWDQLLKGKDTTEPRPEFLL